jgi:hypothetical protein
MVVWIIILNDVVQDRPAYNTTDRTKRNKKKDGSEGIERIKG